MPVFLFTDIENSSRLWEEHTAEMSEVISRHDAILRQTIESNGGRITKHTGDGVTAAFEVGKPIACALETQQRFAAEAWGAIGELRIRAGLHAGEAEFQASAGTPEGDYFGPAVNATARVMSAAWGGQVLLTAPVSHASPLPPGSTLRDLGKHLLTNVSVPQQLLQLDHPQLPLRHFPPPRTLSSQSIRQAVDERGRELAGLAPPHIAIDLVTAALAPTLQGELDPDSGALAANLGVLGDLGAGTLRALTAQVAGRLRTGGEAGESPGLLGIRTLLGRELLAQWQAGGGSSADLRAEISLLLQSLHTVEAAMDAAPLEVRHPLAQALATLGDGFDEFRWMLSGLTETMAEVQARQALQLAMQKEQLDLQREQLAKTERLMKWHEAEHLPDGTPVYSILQMPASEAGVAAPLAPFGEYDVGVLDLPSLTAVYASRGEWAIGPREAALLVRSALHHGVDAQPWLRRMGSSDTAVRVLLDNYEQYPQAAVRERIVEGLAALPGGAATDALVHVALRDDAPDVRVQASLAAAERGRATETLAGLVQDLEGPHKAAAQAAFVAVADETGIPPDIAPYASPPVLSAVAWRRWEANRQVVLRQTGRSALVGPIVSLLGCLTPLFYYLAFPEEFHHLTAEVIPLSAWMFSGALIFVLIGSLQGATSGFVLGVADAVWKDVDRRSWRWAAGLASGLAMTAILTLFTLWRVMSPDVSAGVCLPLFLLSGLVTGAAATMVIPRLGDRPYVGELLKRASWAALLLAVTTIPVAFLAFRSTAFESFMVRLLFAIGFPLALALLFGCWRDNRTRALELADHGGSPP